jgi:transglutaminase-like putative cysteine protease
MRISVAHTTVYRYDNPVWQEPHTFRMRPRTDAAQRLIRHELTIAPTPAGQSWCLDQDGNVVLETWFHEPMETLSVASAFEVETLRENPYDFLAQVAALPATLAPYLAHESNEAVEAMARGIDAQTTPAYLGELNRLLFEEFGHVVRDEGPALAPEATLEARCGTCRDLTVLFCAAARARGIPARFVSGYEREASIQDRPYMHAWAEVYLPGGGWRGFDPSQGLAVATSHVAVAAAADPAMAAPVSGTYRGPGRATMEFQIAMQVAG